MKRALEAISVGLLGGNRIREQDVGTLRSQRDVCKGLAERGGDSVVAGKILARTITIQRRAGALAGQ